MTDPREARRPSPRDPPRGQALNSRKPASVRPGALAFRFGATLALLAAFAAPPGGARVLAGQAADSGRPSAAAIHYSERRRASELYERRRWSELEPVLRVLVEGQPGDPELWYRLAQTRRNLDRPLEAIEAYRRSYALGYRYGAWIPYQIARLYAQSERADSALVWLERTLEEGWGDRPGIGSDPAFETLREEPRFRELAGRRSGRPESRAESWRRDLDYLVYEAKRLHADPERRAFSLAFDSAAASLHRRIPELSNDQIVVEMARLLARLGDGHTGVYGPDPESPLRFAAGTLPLLLYSFDNGLYVVDAAGEARRWIGSRVVAFGPHPAEEVLAALTPYTHRDNPRTVEWLGVRFRLPTLAFLQAVGATDDPSRATLTLVEPGGTERRVEFAGGDHLGQFRRKLRAPPGLVGDPPLYLRNVDRNYWLERLKGQNAVYFQFNQVRDIDGGPTIAEFADTLRGVLERSEARTLIVDVRHNNGGNNGLLRPLVRMLVWWEMEGTERHDRTGRHRIFVITGRNTFSAAQNFINRLERWTDAVFVGETSSSRPNFVGEETNLLLPHSRVRGSISNRYWQDSDPDDDRPWIAPDIPVGLTSADYFGGRDPALEAILEVLDGS